ncbi:MAG: hypothetical protein SGI92_17700 [Bryobacteraceae bacterium]|nr:hypothetical protein [Bryobacteraceae bacterium]
MAGRTGEINEQQIGVHVFGRKADYNPGEDNIVRVEARNLRKRLQEYFDGDGRHEPLIITIPKGHYAPWFDPRPAEVPAELELAPVVGRTQRPALPWVLAGVFAVLVVVLLVRAFAHERSQSHPLWSQLFDANHQTLIALADSNFALYQDLTGQDIKLENYIGAKYLPWEKNPMFSTLARRQYTSLADATLPARIMEAHPQAVNHMAIRFARSLQIRDFKTGNSILIGSRRANPWVELFEPQLNFTVAYEAGSRRVFVRNRSPLAGERARYFMESNDTQTGQAYGVLAFVPNLARTGMVLLIQGLNMEGTEAASEFVLSSALTTRLIAAVGGAQGAPLPPFEALVRLKTMGGGASGAEIIAVRRLAK